MLDARGPQGKEWRRQFVVWILAWVLGEGLMVVAMEAVRLTVDSGLIDGENFQSLWEFVAPVKSAVCLMLLLFLMRVGFGPLWSSFAQRMGSFKPIPWLAMVSGGALILMVSVRFYFYIPVEGYDGSLLELFRNLLSTVFVFITFFVLLQNLVLEKPFAYSLGILLCWILVYDGIARFPLWQSAIKYDITDFTNDPTASFFWVRMGSGILLGFLAKLWGIIVYRRYRTLWPVVIYLTVGFLLNHSLGWIFSD